MWQKNYAYEDIPQAIEALPELRRELERHPASKDVLLQIFVAGYGWQEATELLDSLDRELPGLKRTGCSEYISGDMEHPCGVKLNLLGTEEAEILVVELPCTPGGEEGAASQLEELLDRRDFFRCSKSVILHLNKVQQLKPEITRNILATLVNGERVVISRRYAPELKKLLGIG